MSDLSYIVVALVLVVSSVKAQSGIGTSSYVPPASTRNAPLALNDTLFLLYTQSTLEGNRVFTGDSDSLRAANFDTRKPTVLVTHGFQSSRFLPGQVRLRQAHMDTQDVNYFVVDWSACANFSLPHYPVTTHCAYKVGGFIANFISFLLSNGAQLPTFQLIGHSLGAHAVSQVSNYGIKVPRITGFDPTQVLFWGTTPTERLDPTDADFVDVIHTNVNLQGWNMILGHTDFFPSGGDNQPFCGFLDFECNHEAPYTYYSNTLYNNYIYPATQCGSLTAANWGVCRGATTYMGLISPQGPRGIFYIDMQGRE